MKKVVENYKRIKNLGKFEIDDEVYVDGFTVEQVYYQTLDLTKSVIERVERYIEKRDNSTSEERDSNSANDEKDDGVSEERDSNSANDERNNCTSEERDSNARSKYRNAENINEYDSAINENEVNMSTSEEYDLHLIPASKALKILDESCDGESSLYSENDVMSDYME
ncbi:hypothetical protein TCON_1891 [Astathelohania contejeani]|uniref:Uncharacterized protein n=1 Tax=Astathelohania contejeani TaxID=164912 RepID=A0ABQ7HXK2_9MICR|nr:hypothetical protein TCON_1891 [Thelohania contejeani]